METFFFPIQEKSWEEFGNKDVHIVYHISPFLPREHLANASLYKKVPLNT